MGMKVIAVRGADQKLCSGQTVATPDAAAALKKELLIPGTGRLYSLTLFNKNAGAQYIQLHDSASVPAEGSVPEVVIKCLADDDRSEDFSDGILFKRGIYICNSSTPDTKTIGADDCLIRAQFRLGR